jgi:hypothetical protein
MKRKKSKGLGDTIEQITNATGIKAVVDKFSEVTGIDCGCEERKEKLNNLIPYHKNVECINDEDKAYLDNFFATPSETLTIKKQDEIRTIYKNVFGVTLEQTSCSDCWRTYISELRRIWEIE